MHSAMLLPVLRSRFRKESWLSIVGGFFLLGAAAIVLVLKFWAAYALTWFVAGHGLDEATRLWIATCVIFLLVLANAVSDRQQLSEWRVATGTVSDQVVTFYVPRVG